MIGRAIGRAVLGRRLRAAPAKTYDDFVAHITGLATSGVRPWSNANTGWGQWRVTAAAATGSLVGSSWLGSFSGSQGSTPARVVQHGLPSQSVFNDQVTNGRQIYIKVAQGTEGAYTGRNRNGFTSASGSSDASPDQCEELIYWDGTQAWRMQPNLGLGPTPYTW